MLFTLVSSQYLSVDDFGRFNFILAFIMFGMRFLESGIGDYYLIKGNKKDLAQIFKLNLLKGSIVFILLMIATFIYNFDEKTFIPLILTSTIFIIEPFRNPEIYRLYKINKTSQIVLLEKGSYLLCTLIGILGIINYQNLIVLPLVFILNFIIQIVFSFKLYPKSWSFFAPFNWIYIKGLFKYSSAIILMILVSYFSRQGIDTLIPKWIGFESFGIFSFNFILATAPINLLIYPLLKLLYPLFAKKRLHQDFTKLVKKQIILVSLIFGLVISSLNFLLPLLFDFIEIKTLFQPKLYLILSVYAFLRGAAGIFSLYFKVKLQQKALNLILILEAVILVVGLYLFHNNMTSITTVFILSIGIQFFCLLILFTSKKHFNWDILFLTSIISFSIYYFSNLLNIYVVILFTIIGVWLFFSLLLTNRTL